MKHTFIFVSALFCISLALTEHSMGQGRRPGPFPIPQEMQPFWPHEHHEHAGGGRIFVDVIVGNEVFSIETTNPHGISIVPSLNGGHKLQIGPNDRIVARNNKTSPPQKIEDGSPNVSTAKTQMMLERGDVILSVNGVTVLNAKQAQELIQRSPSVMIFTVRDHQSGASYRMQTNLNKGDLPRLDVTLGDHPSGGARIVSCATNSPSVRCFLLEKIVETISDEVL